MRDDFDATDLRIISAIAVESSLADVALRLGMAKSTISMRIDRMEKRIGTQLVIMTNPLTLTTAGNLTLDAARDIERIAKNHKKNLHSLFCRDSLSICAIPALLVDDALAVYEEFIQQQPKTRIKLVEATADKIIQNVKNSTVDIALTVHNRNVDGLTFETYRTSKIVLIAHKRHPLAKFNSIKFEDTKGFHFVDFDDSIFMAQTLEAAIVYSNTFPLKTVHVMSLDVGAMAAAKNNNLLCLNLESVAKRIATSHEAKIIYLTDPWANVNLTFVTKSLDEKRTPSMHKFISLLKTKFRDNT